MAYEDPIGDYFKKNPVNIKWPVNENQPPMWPYMIAIVVVLVLLLSSCSAEKMANFHCKRCPTKDSSFVKETDSSTSKVDTTWKTFYNPADSLKLADNLSAYMDSLGKCRVKDSQGETESGKIKVKYVIRNDSIFIDCNTKPYEIKIAELTKTINHYHSLYEYHRKTATIKEKKKCNWWLPFILGNITMLIIWQRKRILGLILRLVKPVG